MDAIDENPLFEKSHTEIPAKEDSKDKPETIRKTDGITKQNSETKLSKADSVASLDTTSTSSSDGDWEKVGVAEK